MVTTIERPHLSRPGLGRHGVEQRISAIAFPTALDWMAIAWHDEGLCGFVFGHASRRQSAIALARSTWLLQFWRLMGEGQLAEAPAWVGDVALRLQRFASGDVVEFDDVPLSLDHLSPFARRVVAACRQIRWGQTMSYGELAAACGSPGAARAVGSVMAKNRYPLMVPCHRVLGAGGALGGYSAPDGLRMKRRLLAMEGQPI